MNHASGAVTPPDAEVAQVGNAIWQRAERRGRVQGRRGRRVGEAVGSRTCPCPSPRGRGDGHGRAEF